MRRRVARWHRSSDIIKRALPMLPRRGLFLLQRWAAVKFQALWRGYKTREAAYGLRYEAKMLMKRLYGKGTVQIGMNIVPSHLARRQGNVGFELHDQPEYPPALPDTATQQPQLPPVIPPPSSPGAADRKAKARAAKAAGANQTLQAKAARGDEEARLALGHRAQQHEYVMIWP